MQLQYIIWLPEWEPVPSDPDDAIDYMSLWDYGEYSEEDYGEYAE